MNFAVRSPEGLEAEVQVIVLNECEPASVDFHRGCAEFFVIQISLSRHGSLGPDAVYGVDCNESVVTFRSRAFVCQRGESTDLFAVVKWL